MVGPGGIPPGFFFAVSVKGARWFDTVCRKNNVDLKAVSFLALNRRKIQSRMEDAARETTNGHLDASAL